MGSAARSASRRSGWRTSVASRQLPFLGDTLARIVEAAQSERVPRATLADGLDVAGGGAVVFQRPAEVGNATVHRIAADVTTGPELIEQIRSGDHLACPTGQMNQNVHGQWLHATHLVVPPDSSVQRLHLPVADPEGVVAGFAVHAQFPQGVLKRYSGVQSVATGWPKLE